MTTAFQEERLLQWKEHFKSLVGNPREITDKKIMNDQLDIKLE